MNRRIFLGSLLGTFVVTRLPWMAEKPAEIGFRLAIELSGDDPLIKAPILKTLFRSTRSGTDSMGQRTSRIDRFLQFHTIKYEDPGIEQKLIHSRLVFLGWDYVVPITAVGQSITDRGASGIIVRLPRSLPKTLGLTLDSMDIPICEPFDHRSIFS